MGFNGLRGQIGVPGEQVSVCSLGCSFWSLFANVVLATFAPFNFGK